MVTLGEVPRAAARLVRFRESRTAAMHLPPLSPKRLPVRAEPPLYRSLYFLYSSGRLARCHSISSGVTGRIRMSDASQTVSEIG
jgi:hypothetical protein